MPRFKDYIFWQMRQKELKLLAAIMMCTTFANRYSFTAIILGTILYHYYYLSELFLK